MADPSKGLRQPVSQFDDTTYAGGGDIVLPCRRRLQESQFYKGGRRSWAPLPHVPLEPCLPLDVSFAPSALWWAGAAPRGLRSWSLDAPCSEQTTEGLHQPRRTAIIYEIVHYPGGGQANSGFCLLPQTRNTPTCSPRSIWVGMRRSAKIVRRKRLRHNCGTDKEPESRFARLDNAVIISSGAKHDRFRPGSEGMTTQREFLGRNIPAAADRAWKSGSRRASRQQTAGTLIRKYAREGSVPGR